MPYSTDTITTSNIGDSYTIGNYVDCVGSTIDRSYTISTPEWTIESPTFTDAGVQLISPWLEKKIDEMVEKKLKECLGMKAYMLGIMIGGDYDGD